MIFKCAKRTDGSNYKMKFLKKIKESRLNLILLLLYPIVTFYLLEWFTHNPWKTMKATPQVLNIIMFELIALLLFALFGRLHAALMTETLFFFLYGLVNYFVLNFRSCLLYTSPSPRDCS